MKNNLILTITSLLSILFATFHLTDDTLHAKAGTYGQYKRPLENSVVMAVKSLSTQDIFNHASELPAEIQKIISIHLSAPVYGQAFLYRVLKHNVNLAPITIIRGKIDSAMGYSIPKMVNQVIQCLSTPETNGPIPAIPVEQEF